MVDFGEDNGTRPWASSPRHKQVEEQQQQEENSRNPRKLNHHLFREDLVSIKEAAKKGPLSILFAWVKQAKHRDNINNIYINDNNSNCNKNIKK